MNEPLKKPDPATAPESHSPKDRPEIIQLAGQLQQRTEEPPLASSGGSGIIPLVCPLIKDERGENYWFNGCVRYAMEALGEPDYDYWFFAGLTGDIFTQIYSFREDYEACAASDFLMGPDYALWVFARVGYDCTYVTEPQLLANRAHYLQKIMDSIDRGVPVIHCGWGVFVGYEDGGQTLLYLTRERTEPKRLALGTDRFIAEPIAPDEGQRSITFPVCDLIFVGEKTRQVPLAQLYREAFERLPAQLTIRTDDYIFGAEAFRAWADDIENGRISAPAPRGGDAAWWSNYSNYVCVLATNGSCCFRFLDKAMELNPDMAWLREVSALYKKMGDMWMHDKDCLEKLGGGFNVSAKTLGNPKKRARIVAKIRQFADCADEVLRILEKSGTKGLREPLKKPDPATAPESYNPKDRPEILRMAVEYTGSLRPLRALRSFQEAFEIFRLPACRAIGVEQIYKMGEGGEHAAAPQRDRVPRSEVWPILWALPKVIPEDNCIGWTCGWATEPNAFCYLVAVLCPAGTPVPEGCQYRDVPATEVAVGLWGEDMGKVIKRAKKQGYDTHYNDGGCCWNFELYLDAETKALPHGNQEWRWAVPVREAKKHRK
ncbi:MAG: GyrI-like domain-containing protein [Oscillospiraceae bacterium]|jgi:hypothetical protein|nr:GyrI-like domain-containing protein [Oscillospiraceae bacterium]